MGLSYPIPANQYDSLAYYYANSSNSLPFLLKNSGDQTLINIDYSTVSSSPIAMFTFTINIGSGPPLLISSAAVSNNTDLQFVASEGVPGVSYILTIGITFNNTTTRTDTLEIDIPSGFNGLQPLTGVINQGNPLTGEGAVFINDGPRLFVSSTQPSGALILDQWYNLTNDILYEFVTTGITNEWMQIGFSPPLSFSMENLTIATLNTFPNLRHQYAPGSVMILIINGQTFTSIDSTSSFTAASYHITWTSVLYSVPPGSSVVAIYQYEGM